MQANSPTEALFSEENHQILEVLTPINFGGSKLVYQKPSALKTGEKRADSIGACNPKSSIRITPPEVKSLFCLM